MRFNSRFTTTRIFMATLLTTIFLPATTLPCTTFCFEDSGQWIFGRNFDWSVEVGLVVVNKRGIEKTSYVEDNPASWTSRYGSITFNQHGRELPMGGMNEAGLVVECMWLKATEYPPPDSRSALGEAQWIQYQLDSAATVQEVIASDADVRITPHRASPIHFLVCDSQGGCASIEFLGGEMVVHTGESMLTRALTNNSYKDSQAFLEACAGDESSAVFQTANYSLKRFFWAAQGARGYAAGPRSAHGSGVDHAFAILNKASVGRTQWRVVYDIGGGSIYFRTRSLPEVRFIDLHSFDFSCDSPVTILDMGRACAGDVSPDFVEYTYEANYNLIRISYAETDFLQNVSEEALQWIARYPESMPCRP
jgi:choloylglycine hydrolase